MAIQSVREPPVKVSLHEIESAMRSTSTTKISDLIAIGESRGYFYLADLITSSDMQLSEEIRLSASQYDVYRLEQLLKNHDDVRKGVRPSVRIEKQARRKGTGSNPFTSLIVNMRGEHTDEDIQARISQVDSAIEDMLGRNLSESERQEFVIGQILILVEHANRSPRSRTVFHRKIAELSKAHRIDPHALGSVVNPNHIKRQ